ncbi:Na(+)/H(+) antiporter subunit C [Streptomyces hainanensis]|uniref:Na(+)/H(+) antiporter subunit C n=1 Tax=Streptomyces hainanensis TaxID=402648 RepID=A0A4R4TF20_9ACTN|nr:Na(+)/H(+) antiporter subunit C [Streptomyces hainanensis]
MTVSATLLACAVVLTSAGVVLIHTRALTRVLIGIIVCGNGINLFVLAATGRAGVPPLLYPGVSHARVTDPLPQAIILTAVVISLATTAFTLAIAYRSGQLTGSDFVPDDTEDHRVLQRTLHTRRPRPNPHARDRTTDDSLWNDILGTDPPPPRQDDDTA